MLNYIWVGLIVTSFVFALASDVTDFTRDTYRNGTPLPVTLEFDAPYDSEARRQPATVRIDGEAYGAFYDTDARPADAYDATLIRTAEGVQLRLAAVMGQGFADDAGGGEPDAGLGHAGGLGEA